MLCHRVGIGVMKFHVGCVLLEDIRENVVIACVQID